MTTAAPELKDALRQHLEGILADQEDHPVFPKFELVWNDQCTLGQVTVRAGKEMLTVHPTAVEGLIDDRALEIADQKRDPYNFGYEPDIWHETDWRLAELRCSFPGEPLILGVLGGNGGGKSHYASKRFAMCMQEAEDWLCLQLSLDQSGSEEVPQRYIYDYLDPELRTETGKLKRGVAQSMTYNVNGGFTNNSFSLANKCRADFKFYGGGDVNSMEGLRPDVVWADEMVTPDWVRAAQRRLMTKAEKSNAILPQLKEALAARSRGEADAWKKHLRPILAKLFQGVCLISFTPKNGYTRTVQLLVEKARTLWEVEAELLPIIRDKHIVGYEKVPRVQVNDDERAVIIYYHIYDNPFGGNWIAQKATLSKKGREEKLWRAYGVATRVAGVVFSTFGREAHIRPETFLPREGTWYRIADPCDRGRPWFLIWAKVCPNVIGKELIVVAREWPQPGDYIVAGNVGDPGEWAVLEADKADGRKKSAVVKMDGEEGPAQRGFGLGFRQMAEEIERVERELFKLEQKLAGNPDWANAAGRIEVPDGCSIMDSRAANTETQQHSDSETLIQTMTEYDLFFIASGRDSGAEAGSTTVREGAQFIADRLSYDREQAELTDAGFYKFHGQAPSLFVLENCKNVIFCMQHWTGRDGGRGATKDPIDTLRYLVISNPIHIASLAWSEGGGVY